MGGFIAAADNQDSSQPRTVANTGFWPDISMQTLRDAMRIDNTVTDGRLLGAVTEAIASVNAELADWRRQQQAQGYRDAGQVPAEQIDGSSILLQRYLRAVGCRTKATLVERYRDFDTATAGDRRADRLEQDIDDLRRDAAWAISDISGRARTTVDLI